MSLHPQAANYLRQLSELRPKRIEESTPLEIRQTMRAAIPPLAEEWLGISVEDRGIPGPDGDIRLRIYRQGAGGGRPGVVFFHGGGWVAGDLDTHDGVCRALAGEGGATVVSVDYRLSPESRFPAPAEDCFAAWQWVTVHATELALDRGRISVAGDSAGGNLAAAVALMSRDRQATAPAQQILIYPIADHNFSTSSYLTHAEGCGLTRSAMQWFWDQYVPKIEDRSHPYAAPLRASLTGLPPTVVITAEYDVLHDEGEAFARALLQANVPTQLLRYEGMIHGFLHRLHVFDDARHAVRAMAERVRNPLRSDELRRVI